MARILGIGIATLDIVMEVERYPVEDAEIRALDRRRVRGGNVTNTLVTLASLGHSCSWLGTLADDTDAGVIEADLRCHGVDYSLCTRYTATATPLSCILVSRESGSRTIVHHRNLPELPLETSLSALDRQWDWVHFEGRNPEVTRRTLEELHRRSSRPPISLELEKPRPGLEALIPLADLVVVSRAWAAATEWSEAPEALLRHLRGVTRADLVAPWGEGGAYALPAACEEVIHLPAEVVQVVDSVGAGDVFNAGLIDARLRRLSWPESIGHANRLAAAKCRHHGLP